VSGGSPVKAERNLDVEISIANTNSRELLRGCLESLPAACAGLSWRATVVDNASTDGSAEMVRREFEGVGLLQNDAARGFSANHNRVLRRALERSPRYVLILNEDTVLEPGSVGELFRFCDKRPTLGAAGPVITGGDGVLQQSFFRFPSVGEQAAACFRPGRKPAAADGGGWLNGSCVLVRVDALRQVGLLDERFFIFFEDTDLGLRLQQAGWQSAVCPSARIVHYGHQVVSQPIYGNRMERQMVRSRYLYFRKHYGVARAGMLAVLVRTAFTLRAVKALGSSVFLRRSDERGLASILWDLARYDPRVALSHEPVAAMEPR
jgi:N-acetylglucosaminyl-diphospho-decaprenol L-rhamnosyltransferase